MSDETNVTEGSEQSLSEVLREKGFTHKRVPGGNSYAHNVRKAEGGKQHIVFTGDAAECWIWIETGCPYEVPAVHEAEIEPGPSDEDVGIQAAPSERLPE